ncbi:MAG: helix-turn-helix domain-containing protein [Nitrospira sp.]
MKTWRSMSCSPAFDRQGVFVGGTLKPARVTTFQLAHVKSIREKLKVSQAEFALMIGVSVATLRN